MIFNVKSLFVSTLVAGAAVASPVPAEGTNAAPASQVQKREDIPIGKSIFSCTEPNTIALTFDDGPFEWTDMAMDILDKNNMKATFFLNGENKGILSEYQSTLRRMFYSRHQIGSHTWDHPHLSEVSNAEVRAQMTRFEDEMLRLIGYYPTYMRPPYLSYHNDTLEILGDLGYRVADTDIDTFDFEGDIDASFAIFTQGLDDGSSNVLAHDIHEATVTELLPRMIGEIKSRGLKAVTVGECLGEDYSGWYKVSPRSSG